MTIREICAAIGGRVALPEGATGENAVLGVSTDSRTVRPGEVFFALRGKNFDGHAFVRDALAKGASAVVVERAWWVSAGGATPPLSPPLTGEMKGGGIIEVDDPCVALGRLGAYHRGRFAIPVVAVVGSNGKTTTKEMIAQVLGATLRVLKAERSLNNQIGVPMTLLGLEPGHEAVVLELGTNHFGEIAGLCAIARPTVGVMTNIGPAHLEFFGSLEGVAREKGALLEILGEEGVAVLNWDDPMLVGMQGRMRGRIVGYGLEGGDLRAEGIALDGWGCARFRVGGAEVALSVPGKHNVYNALAAMAVGGELGVPLERAAEALGGFRPAAMRSEVVVRDGVTILNDAYNSNPASAKAVLDVLAAIEGIGDRGQEGQKEGREAKGEGRESCCFRFSPFTFRPSRRIAVLGDMFELGEFGPSGHEEVGRHAARLGVDRLVVVGPLSLHTAHGAVAEGMAEEQVRHFAEKGAAVAYLKGLVRAGDVVLVKGSRGMRMEEVVAEL